LRQVRPFGRQDEFQDEFQDGPALRRAVAVLAEPRSDDRLAMILPETLRFAGRDVIS
jgi:hypothetical protein